MLTLNKFEKFFVSRLIAGLIAGYWFFSLSWSYFDHKFYRLVFLDDKFWSNGRFFKILFWDTAVGGFGFFIRETGRWLSYQSTSCAQTEHFCLAQIPFFSFGANLFRWIKLDKRLLADPCFLTFAYFFSWSTIPFRLELDLVEITWTSFKRFFIGENSLSSFDPSFL